MLPAAGHHSPLDQSERHRPTPFSREQEVRTSAAPEMAALLPCRCFGLWEGQGTVITLQESGVRLQNRLRFRGLAWEVAEGTEHIGPTRGGKPREVTAGEAWQHEPQVKDASRERPPQEDRNS